MKQASQPDGASFVSAGGDGCGVGVPPHRYAVRSVTLEVFDQLEPWRRALDSERSQGRRVGVVLTMGSLHAGHASLLARAAAECDVVALTVYVNHLQFGPAEDLAAYPRDLDADRALAAEAGASYLLAPAPGVMWPEPPATVVGVAGLSEGLEGARRPGHFDGVATIVTKLFSLCGPCTTYFGEKDYQQLAIIRRLVSDLSLPVTVVACPTIRHSDGLALSSRNAYLSPQERAVAPKLYGALLAGKRLVEEDGEHRGDAVRAAMAQVVASSDRFHLEYAEVVDPQTLVPLEQLTGEARLVVAARLGRARLIDNLAVGAPGGRR